MPRIDPNVFLPQAFSDDYRLKLLDVLRRFARGLFVAQEQAFIVVCSDEVTPLTTGTAKVTLRAPWSLSITALKAELTVAQDSGSIFTVDVNVEGTSILSTKLTIDNTEETSETAATPYEFASTNLEVAAGEKITIDIDQIGDETAAGLKVTIYAVRL